MHGILNARLTVFASREVSELATFMSDNGGWDYDRAFRHFNSGDNDAAFAESGVDEFLAVKTDYFSEHPAHEPMIIILRRYLGDILLLNSTTYAGPSWMTFGVSSLVAGMVEAQSENRPYRHDFRSRDDATASSSRLDSLVGNQDWLSSLEAIELLVHGAGIRALGDFLYRANDPTTWQRNFESVFGITVSDFYDLYETHWNNGLPDVAIPLEPSEDLSWPDPEDLLRVHSVNSLMPIVANGIVRVSTRDRTGSGFIYRVDDDGTVWVLTDHYLAGLEGITTVELSFANDERVIQGNVHAIHEEKPLAIITACCLDHATALQRASTKLSQDWDSPTLILIGTSEQNDQPPELSGSAGKLINWTIDDNLIGHGIPGDEFDGLAVGSPAFSRTGKVVGILIHDPEHIEEAEEHWVVEVDSESLVINDWPDDSQRLEALKKYDLSPTLPSYLEFVHNHDLRTREENAVKISANQLHDFAVALNLPLPTDVVTIYMHHDLSALEDYWNSEEESAGKLEPDFYGFAEDNAVYMRALDPDTRLKLIGLDGQVGLVAHELTHTLFQLRLSDGGSPGWMSEGMANYFSVLTKAYSINRSFSTVHQDSFDISQDVVPPSSTDEFYKWSSDGSSCVYNCGQAAVRLLASRVGVRGLVRFFENGRADTPWQTTFQQTFGLTVAEFYDLFAEHIDAGFPVLQIPDDPFPEN